MAKAKVTLTVDALGATFLFTIALRGHAPLEEAYLANRAAEALRPIVWDPEAAAEVKACETAQRESPQFAAKLSAILAKELPVELDAPVAVWLAGRFRSETKKGVPIAYAEVFERLTHEFERVESLLAEKKEG
jgi:hypothetical protein